MESHSEESDSSAFTENANPPWETKYLHNHTKEIYYENHSME